MTDTNPHTSAVPTEMIEKAAAVFDAAGAEACGRWTYRRTLDKRAYEVVQWPDPEIAANDMKLAEFPEQLDAALYCAELHHKFVAGAALSAAGVPALVEENRRLKTALSAIRERSGREMDYGSNCSAIQAIYNISADALRIQPAASDAEGA